VELLTVIASQSIHSTPSRPEQAPFKARFLSLTQNLSVNSLLPQMHCYECLQLPLELNKLV